MSDSRVFTCPNDPSQDTDDTKQPDSWWSFQRLTNVSYSYQNQLGRVMSEGSLSARIAIMADKSPLREDVIETPTGADADKDEWLWKSPNHEWTGQNVLYVDGHVEWTVDPTCGYAENNIWIKETWDSDAKEWEEQDAGGRDTQAMIEDSRDSWLVP